MVTGAVAGNISAEATTPTGNIFAEAMRGFCVFFCAKTRKARWAGSCRACKVILVKIGGSPDSCQSYS
jgi:hypothetical protein